MPTRQEIRESEQSMSSILLEVIGPALIMLMVGSLVFFLIEVFYRGPHTGRLCWVFGLFTFASVLVSRVSIESGKERGMIFGFALGLAAFMTSFTLVEFEGALATVLEPILLISFICVVMWSASKLTWDCTVIDKSRDSSATGITELVRRRFQGDVDSTSATNQESNRSEASDAQAGNLIRALFRSRGERKNTPGIWVFYFSMAAIPIFGLGQWFVAPSSNGSYLWVVFLFAVYLAAGLGLMMTTSLLGLQRYLRKRDTFMPPEIARTWLAIGGAVALVVLAIVLVFPRPNATAALEKGLSWFSSPNRGSSEMALGEDGQEEKDSARAQKSSEDGKKTSADAKTKSTAGNQKDADRTESGGNDGKGKQGKSKDGKDGNQEGEKDSGKQSGDKQRTSSSNRGNQKSNSKQGQSKQRKGPNNSSHPNSPQFLRNLSQMATWITYALAAIAAIVLLVLFRKEIASFFQSLFQRQEKDESESSRVVVSQPRPRPPPFEQFRSPFGSNASGMPPEKIVEYTFRALESWAFEQGIERTQDQTPHEFSAQLKRLGGNIGRTTEDLSNLLGKNLFGKRKIRVEELEPLKELWNLMQNRCTKQSPNIALAN